MVVNCWRGILTKYILIDLEDTLTVYQDKERAKSTIIEWLNYNHVPNPEEIISNPDFKRRETRLPLLGINENEYKKWFLNFNEVEFTFFKKNYSAKTMEIKSDAIDFIKNAPYPVILVSNSSPKWIDFILNEYQLTPYFRYIFKRTYEYDDIRKPDKRVADIIENAIHDTISPDSIMIGDAKNDYLFAQNCGFKFIAMFNQFENIPTFDNFTDVADYIKNDL